MSLFNETWARADRAEKALELAQRRIVELEQALKDVRKDKTSDYWWKSKHRYEDNPRSDKTKHNELNTLSEIEVELMFAKVGESVDPAGLKPAAHSMPVRSRLLAPLLKLLRCAERAQPSNAEAAGRG